MLHLQISELINNLKRFDRETIDNAKKITTQFEKKIQNLEAELTTVTQEKYEAERVMENIKKRLEKVKDKLDRFVQNIVDFKLVTDSRK